MASIIQCSKLISSLPLFWKLKSISMKVSLFPLIKVSPGKCASNFINNTINNFLFFVAQHIIINIQIYQDIVHWCQLTTLLAIHGSQGFILIPISLKIDMYNWYQKKEDSIIPYNAFKN